MVKTEWKRIFSHKEDLNKSSSSGPGTRYWKPSRFNELIAACAGKTNVMVMVK